MSNKTKILIGVGVLIALIAGASAYFLLNQKSEVNEPSEKVTLGGENKSIDGKKVLVAYFSVPETGDANKEMTQEEENSAIVVDGQVLGNTQYVANIISENTGGDIYRIEPSTPYTTNHKELVEQATKEQDSDVRPEIKDMISNFDDYDTIFIGYPIWWGDMPQIMYSFMELYSFEGKTVIPFSTHGGSGLAGTVNTIENKLTNANVITNAFTMSRDDMEEAPQRVEDWLREINLKK
ncbi:flavodoxin [Enterococcus sp. AZ072]|uniref:flavodoxin n=1 Tax=unclassified Enterococcus TaxID=2608891 RepID=UPI003D2BF106